jgi:hypothetical protein
MNTTESLKYSNYIKEENRQKMTFYKKMILPSPVCGLIVEKVNPGVIFYKYLPIVKTSGFSIYVCRL